MLSIDIEIVGPVMSPSPPAPFPRPSHGLLLGHVVGVAQHPQGGGRAAETQQQGGGGQEAGAGRHFGPSWETSSTVRTM